MKSINKIFLVAAILFAGCGIQKKESAASVQQESPQQESGETGYDYSSTPENAEYIFIASHDGNLDDYKHKALILLKNSVEANSNGRIGIQIYPNGQLAKALSERMDGVIQKSFDIVNTTGDVSAYWEPLSVFDLPYMITDDRLIEEVFSAPEFVNELRQGALEATQNARLMVITNSGRWRNFATTQKQIQSVADLQGLKIRTVASKVQQQLVSALGASPTSMAWGDLYTALSTGVVDGTKNGMVDIVNAKLNESLHYIILDGHAYMAGFWWMNNEKFQSLPADLKKIMVDGFEALSWFIRQYNKYAEASAFNSFQATGGKIYRPTEAQLVEFQERAEAVEQWFSENVSQDTKEWLKRYKQEIARQQSILDAARELEIQ